MTIQSSMRFLYILGGSGLLCAAARIPFLCAFSTLNQIFLDFDEQRSIFIQVVGYTREGGEAKEDIMGPKSF